MNARKLLRKVLSGGKNVRFSDMQRLVQAYGFRLDRVTGSHHIYVHPNVRELINLQNDQGKAKPYQIKQFLSIVERYNLQMKETG